MCVGGTSTQYLDVQNIKRCSSSPSLAVPVPQVTRKVPPVPLPRRKSAAEECQRVKYLKNCARGTTTTTSGVSRSLELGTGMKAKSCHDLKSLCTTADCCGHENNNQHVSELANSLTDGRFSTAGTNSLHIATSADKIVKRPAIPPRFKRHLRKDGGSLCTDKISSPFKKSVSRMESLSDSESSAVKQSKKFPQPRPRLSLIASAVLPADTDDQEQSKLLHNGGNDLAIDGDSESACLDTECDRNADRKMPMHTADASGEGEKLHTLTNDGCSFVESEQHELVPQNDVPADSQNTEVLVPTRAAPPPPLPKPKILLHASGSFEIIQPCSECNAAEHTTLPDGDIATDPITSNVRSPSASENDDKTINERNLQQPVEDSEAGLFNCVSPTSSESCVSDVFYPNDVSNAPSVVLSTATPVDVSSTANAEPSSRIEGCKMSFPKPAFRRKKGKSELLCRGMSGISSSADFERGFENVHSRAAAAQSWSEDIVHGDDSNDLHLTPVSVDKSSLKRCQAQNVPSRPFSLSEMGRRHAASDLRRNSSSSSSYVTESSCLSPVVTPTDSPLSRINHEIFAADTPPITPSAFGFDAHDEEARMVC